MSESCSEQLTEIFRSRGQQAAGAIVVVYAWSGSKI